MQYLWDWDELEHHWDSNDFGAVHDWLNERWAQIVKTSPGGDKDADARFMQGLAYAALALYFTQDHNQESARLFLDDALMVLPQYKPSHMGVMVEPVLETLHTLRPAIAHLGPDAECPFQPFVYNKLMFEQG
ncbi:MAG: DUF309 domain-containing protein [Gammaproteobacteria bacterium]|nr:DUF309 domain-containing protein [Gammaproteobacteria bacterium]MBU1777775.1 DUF309 domain-containing protein [Gammaproteobacteria bacterium]MBU1969983.1 DUF309 domain-containing protein [Gammaproteobacteria bacterium]